MAWEVGFEQTGITGKSLVPFGCSTSFFQNATRMTIDGRRKARATFIRIHMARCLVGIGCGGVMVDCAPRFSFITCFEWLVPISKLSSFAYCQISEWWVKNVASIFFFCLSQHKWKWSVLGQHENYLIFKAWRASHRFIVLRASQQYFHFRRLISHRWYKFLFEPWKYYEINNKKKRR